MTTSGPETIDAPLDLNSMNRALVNILEDFAEERRHLQHTQRAVVNIIEDFADERAFLKATQSAVLNILDDFQGERENFQNGQRASLNILEDFAAERGRLETTQKAVLNILDDFDGEREKVHNVNEKLRQEIEERIGIENALTAKGSALSRSNAELEQFAYIASHDLQAPLRTISSYVEIVSAKLASDDVVLARHFGYIVEGVTRMQGLIKALLEYSRVGRESRPPRQLDCGDICQEVMRDLKAAIAENGGSVTWNELPIVIGDYTLLRQLFQNLIANALKFHGGAPPVVRISASRQGDQWQVHVRDNGIGIDVEHASRLFTIFQRLHTREKYPGTGIGLAICKKIVETHGGRIWIEPRAPGDGAEFVFTLPSAGVGSAS